MLFDSSWLEPYPIRLIGMCTFGFPERPSKSTVLSLFSDFLRSFLSPVDFYGYFQVVIGNLEPN